jgi:hypothetical protein
VDPQAEPTVQRGSVTKDVSIVRIDHIPPHFSLPGMWQDFYDGEIVPLTENCSLRTSMKNIKFVVKVNRGGARGPAYVQSVDRTPLQMTTDRKLALLMGKFTAEDAIKSLENSRCSPELVSVQVSA